MCWSTAVFHSIRGSCSFAIAVCGIMAVGGIAPAQAQDHDWLIAPHMAVGIVPEGRPVWFAAYGVTVAWRGAPQLSYQRTGFGPTCKQSHQPSLCDVSSARHLLAGWSVPVYRQGDVVLRLRPEAGIGWWRSNDRRTRGPVFGAAAESVVRVGPAGALLFGVHARHSSIATILGATIGLGLAF